MNTGAQVSGRRTDCQQVITVPPSFVDAWHLRVIALALVLAAFPGSATSQAVSSVQLSKTVTIDGLYFGADGTLYALEGFSGNRILRIDRSGQVESLP